MKVPASVRRIFDDQEAICLRLKESVEPLVQSFRDARWHYEKRIKTLQSFALKIESGRFHDPKALEDFFACTLVVANAAEIDRAVRLVGENFKLAYRRPERDDQTHKTSHSFPFDDLRLYVSLPETPSLPPSDLAGVVFEFQIKTFLQHAWSIATHDLVYKSDGANWSKERIAFQTKAMLEHAEISIQEAERLATCTTLAKEDSRTSQLKAGIALLKQQWNADELPVDVRRLAENVLELLGRLKIDIVRLEAVLNAGKAAGAGAHPLNLSPFGAIVQYLFAAEKAKMSALLTKDDRRALHVLIPAEVEIPIGVDRAVLRNAIFVA